MRLSNEAILQEIDRVLHIGAPLLAICDKDDGASNGSETVRVIALYRSCIGRFAPPGSTFVEFANKVVQTNTHLNWTMVSPLAGILKALRGEYEAGALQTVTELVHADLFSNVLDQARHLLDSKFKAAAAVAAGTALEGHLRQLCRRHSLPTENADGEPLRASRLNADLYKAGAYASADQDQINGWNKLRGNAAHPEPEPFEPQQVALMIEGIRDFIARCPA